MKSLMVWHFAEETSTTDGTDDSSQRAGKMLADEPSITILDYSVLLSHSPGAFTGFSIQPGSNSLSLLHSLTQIG